MTNSRYLSIQRTTFKISDFVTWARSGTLDLSPYYQRRSVWKSPAKSLLIDTIMRGLPVPIIILRDRIDLKSQMTTREVVDGQQRIRTVLTYLGFVPSAAVMEKNEDDWTPFSVLKAHNERLSAAKGFDSLPKTWQRRFLEYQFSVHVLPSDIEDTTVLRIFTRLNSTGQKLTSAEIRNAEFHGPFASLVKDLAISNIHRWRELQVLSDAHIARMAELDLVADLCIAAARGEIYANTATNIRNFYKRREEEESWEYAKTMTSRFDTVVDQLTALIGDDLRGGPLTNRIVFSALWMVVYDYMYGLDRSLSESVSGKRLPTSSAAKLRVLDGRLRNVDSLPTEVASALRGAASDVKNRRIRFDFLKRGLGW